MKQFLLNGLLALLILTACAPALPTAQSATPTIQPTARPTESSTPVPTATPNFDMTADCGLFKVTAHGTADLVVNGAGCGTNISVFILNEDIQVDVFWNADGTIRDWSDNIEWCGFDETDTIMGCNVKEKGMITFTVAIKSTAEEGVLRGQKAPNFTLIDFQGGKHSLYDFHGNIIVLHFWYASCPPCNEEMPEIIQAAKDHPGVKFVLVNQWDKMDEIAAFYAQFEAYPDNFINLWEAESDGITDLFIVQGVPSTIILNPQGEILMRYTGPVWEDWEKYLVK